MAQFRNYLGKTYTGRTIPKYRKKKRREVGRDPTLTKLGEKEKKVKIRSYGGNYKLSSLEASYINITNIGKKVKILDVVENKANPNFTRAKIITRGAIVKTELGLAIVTSRPGQDGIVNGVLIEKK